MKTSDVDRYTIPDCVEEVELNMDMLSVRIMTRFSQFLVTDAQQRGAEPTHCMDPLQPALKDVRIVKPEQDRNENAFGSLVITWTVVGIFWDISSSPSKIARKAGIYILLH